MPYCVAPIGHRKFDNNNYSKPKKCGLFQAVVGMFCLCIVLFFFTAARYFFFVFTDSRGNSITKPASDLFIS